MCDSVQPLAAAVEIDLADHSLSTLPDEIFQRSTRERADRFQIWQLLSSGQKLGRESGRINKFMAVFSHELRNSLDAIRGAARILRLDTCANPSAVKARMLIERQVGR
jgi:signal transduction histidine kinase